MPYYRQVPLDLVIVDERYQRDIIPTHVENIRRDFDEAKLDVLHMSKRSEDEYACLDGQHRLIVLNERDDQKTAPSLVHEGLTPQEEAILFRELQEGRRQLQPLDKFNARVFHEDPIAVGVTETIQSFGIKIGAGPGSVQSIVAYERVYRRGNLQDAMQLQQTWKGDPKWLEGPLIDGISRFLDLFAEADRDRARAVWGEFSPTQILRNASDLVSSSKAGGVLEFLRNAYSSKKFPLPTVAKAQEERKAVMTAHGKRYRRVSLEETRDAARELAQQHGQVTVHMLMEKLQCSRPALVKKGGLIDKLLDYGWFVRKRDGNGPYYLEQVSPGKEQSRLIAERKSRSNGKGPRVTQAKAVQGTGKPKRRPGTRDIMRTGKR